MITETDSGVIDKNLYAYCDGSPVMRKDNGGEFWNVVIGATLGAACELGYQLIVEKKSLNKISWVDVGASAISGGLAATGLGAMGQVIANGIISGASSYIKGDRGTDLVVSAGLGLISGKIGGKGANYKGAISDIKNYTKNKLKREVKRFVKNPGYAKKNSKRLIAGRNNRYWGIFMNSSRGYMRGYLSGKAGSYGYNYWRGR